MRRMIMDTTNQTRLQTSWLGAKGLATSEGMLIHIKHSD